MNKKQPYIIANWKMEKPLSSALRWVKENTIELKELGNLCTFILCPDFCTLWPIDQLIPRNIFLGAQQCSPYKNGPYTGQVSAQSLYDARCTYTIIGHAEQRVMGNNDQQVSQQTAALLEVSITPIICIGENQQQKHNTLAVLEEQLLPVCIQLATYHPNASVLIAYEPIWSIGTNEVPTPMELQNIIDHIKKIFYRHTPLVSAAILYGGSINQDRAQSYRQHSSIDGFLIGRASLDFQMLKKIVLSTLHNSF